MFKAITAVDYLSIIQNIKSMFETITSMKVSEKIINRLKRMENILSHY